jgi:glycosidase
MLDFVPNHMAPDHPWVDEHPDYFVQGGESDLAHVPATTSKRAS